MTDDSVPDLTDGRPGKVDEIDSVEMPFAPTPETVLGTPKPLDLDEGPDPERHAPPEPDPADTASGVVTENPALLGTHFDPVTGDTRNLRAVKK